MVRESEEKRGLQRDKEAEGKKERERGEWVEGERQGKHHTSTTSSSSTHIKNLLNWISLY